MQAFEFVDCRLQPFHDLCAVAVGKERPVEPVAPDYRAGCIMSRGAVGLRNCITDSCALHSDGARHHTTGELLLSAGPASNAHREQSAVTERRATVVQLLDGIFWNIVWLDGFNLSVWVVCRQIEVSRSVKQGGTAVFTRRLNLECQRKLGWGNLAVDEAWTLVREKHQRGISRRLRHLVLAPEGKHFVELLIGDRGLFLSLCSIHLCECAVGQQDQHDAGMKQAHVWPPTA
ncbi:MAG: hypothetical protein ICCCNLDF_02531 [Planctomycetes bacterium]|nr:hypothetical protein [Planctomycetota bacterium]